MSEVMVTVCYDQGNIVHRDDDAHAIADEFGAEFCGSGCWMAEPFTRDMQYEISAARAEEFAAALKKVGFDVTVHPNED